MLNQFIFTCFSRSPISVAAAAIYLASQASEGKKSQKGKVAKELTKLLVPYYFFLKVNYLSVSLEIGDIAGVADVTIRQSYRLMFPRAPELFPSDFKFHTPIEKLPCS